MNRSTIATLLTATLLICPTLYGQHTTPGSPNKNATAAGPSFFPMNEVVLLSSPFKTVKEKVHENLLKWEADRLLHWHRKAAGLEPKAAHYGGWENGGSNILGHYLTAISLMYSSTKDARLKKRVDYIVNELDECQRAAKNGHIFNGLGFGEAFEKMEQGKFEYRVIGPEFPLINGGNYFYGIHKNIAGLRDAYQLAGSVKAKDILIKFVDWIDKFSKSVPDDEFQKMLDVEHGGMTEVIADVYDITGDKKYAELATRFVHRKVSEPIADGRDMLFPHHANAKIPQFVGYAHLYRLVGEEAAREGKSAFNFFDIVLSHHTLANSGNSEYERFGPAGRQSQRIGFTSTETCNTYNMLKLAAELYRLTGNPAYFNYYERGMYNHILASVNENGNFTYYTSVKPGWFKTFSTTYNSNWCCVGSGLENPGKYEQHIYAVDDRSVYINLFIPSRLSPKQKELALEQTGGGISDTVNIRIVRTGANKTLRIRKPDWAGERAAVFLNGKKIVAPVETGYFHVTASLKKNDRIELYLPRSLRVEATPDNNNIAAIFYGPVLLAGELGNEGLENESFENSDAWGLLKYPVAKNIPVLVAAKEAPASWINKDPAKPLRFIMNAPGRNVILKPYYEFTAERYSVYWDLFSAPEWKAYEADRKAHIIDHINIADSASERNHSLKFDIDISGAIHFKKYRGAENKSWFSYTVNTDSRSPLFLVVNAWGGGWTIEPKGNLDIFLNGVKIGRKVLDNQANQTTFYDEIFEIPASLTAGKKLSELRFEGVSEKSAGGINSIRVVTAEGLVLRDLISQ